MIVSRFAIFSRPAIVTRLAIVSRPAIVSRFAIVSPSAKIVSPPERLANRMFAIRLLFSQQALNHAIKFFAEGLVVLARARTCETSVDFSHNTFLVDKYRSREGLYLVQLRKRFFSTH